MKQLIICTAVLIAAVSCELNSSKKSSGVEPAPEATTVPQTQDPTDASDSIAVFLTGNLLGSLKPCGCSGGQLGGLDRRPGVFDTVPSDKRLLIDTGSLVEDPSDDQDLFKFITIMETFKYLHYDAVNLTKHDIEMARKYEPLDTNSVGFISSYPTDENVPIGNQHEITLDGQKINVSIVGFDPQEKPLEYIERIFPSDTDTKSLNILILDNYSDEIVSQISRLGIVDCLVCPINSDEPVVKSAPGARPLVCAVGKFGRHICKLVVKNAPDGKFALTFEDIPVREEIKKDEYLVGLYKMYQDMVKGANLLEQNPRYVLPDNLKYAGSKSCSDAECHLFEWAVWNENEHSHAYATLEEVGSQYDPECIVCHVVGYDFQTGFRSAEDTPLLENVGCEYCHGPGSAHNKNPYNSKMTPIPDRVKLCEKCHTPEHSGDFAGHEEEKLEIIKHWPEPNDVSNVK